MTTIEIYWNDLTLEAKRNIVEAMGDDPACANDASYNNWDIFPMASFDVETEQEEE